MSHLCWIDGDLEMGNQKDDFQKELMRQLNRETKGMSPSEKEEYIRNMFVKRKTKTAKKMTAAKGGMAKAAKKMMRGGVAKKKMRGGGMAKKKMMRGGAVKKK